MTEPPDPFTPPDADLRDFDRLMLNVERLLASELWAISTGDEFKAAVGLWCRAWKQVPAGSLPNDERVLAAFSGAGRAWSKVRDVAMRGFVLCSDGRLYHKVLCEDVMRAIKTQAERRERTKAATEARKKKRDDAPEVERNGQRDVDRNDVATEPVTSTHRRNKDGISTEEAPRQEKKIINKTSFSVPRLRAAGSFGPDLSDPEVRRQHWLQRITPELIRQQGPAQAMATLEAFERGDPNAKKTLDFLTEGIDAGAKQDPAAAADGADPLEIPPFLDRRVRA